MATQALMLWNQSKQSSDFNALKAAHEALTNVSAVPEAIAQQLNECIIQCQQKLEYIFSYIKLT